MKQPLSSSTSPTQPACVPESAARIAVFAGSFDPFTNGHFDIVAKALKVFDRVVIGVGCNFSKNALTQVELKISMIQKVFANEHRVSVDSFAGLVADFAKTFPHATLVRGLRSAADYSYEMPMAVTNRLISGGIETVFLPASPELCHISSSLVREIQKCGGTIRPFVPIPIWEALEAKIKNETKDCVP